MATGERVLAAVVYFAVAAGNIVADRMSYSRARCFCVRYAVAVGALVAVGVAVEAATAEIEYYMYTGTAGDPSGGRECMR